MNTNTPNDDSREVEILEPAPEPELSGLHGPSGSPESIPKVWGYLDLLYLLMFAVPAFFVIAIVCMGALYGLSHMSGWRLPLGDPQTQAPLVIGVQLAWWIVVLGYIHTVVTAKYGLPFSRSIGWTGLDRPAGVYVGSGFLLAVSVGAASHFIPQPEGKLPIEALLEDPFSMTLMAIFGVLIAPAVEEIVFRGFMYPVVERSHGVVMAVLFTSLIFSFVHGTQYGWRWQNLLLLFGVGVVFGAVRARTGSVTSTTVIHAAYNATLFAALFAAGDQIKNL